jgi:predicted lipid-binding transport protein (Tim44 family)
MSMDFSRRGRFAFALAGVLALAMAGAAEARPGGKGGGFGSRGSRTFDAPAATRTAPTTAAPIQRSQTPAQVQQQRPGAPAGQAAQPSRGWGFGGGLMAGLLGAGLLGALFGSGFFGGLGGLASMLGLLLQVALIGGLIYLALRFFRRRSEPQPAYAGPGGHERSALGGMGPTGGGMGAGLGGLAGLGAGAGAANAPVRRERSDEIGIGPADYGAFEKTLHDVQTAYGREDVAALWTLATPEMAGYLQEELNENARNNAINKISDMRLLQGDLAEAWREGPTDYATVAMRYALKDVTLDRTTGRVIDGDRDRPQEVTELWTFRRDHGGSWKVSAIQPAEQ